MKNKVLNFIIAVLLSLSSLVNTSGVIVQANKNIEPKIFISVKSFKDFLDDIDKIDLDSMDSESRNIYNESLKKISEIYNSKNKNYSDEELRIRINIYWAFITSSHEDGESLIEGLKYLDLTPDEIVSILTTANPKLVGADAELFKLSLSVLLVERSRLSDEDKIIYDKIEKYVRKEHNDFNEDKIRESVNLIWSIAQIDLSKCDLKDRIDVLNEISLDLESFQNIKLLTLKGSNNDIVSSIYEMVLLRDSDEEGKKYWVSVIDKLQKEGKSTESSIDEVVYRMKQENEYRDLVSLFNT